jgi:xanthine dehydrogenase accessory factor
MCSSPLDSDAFGVDVPAPGTGVDAATVLRLASKIETPLVLATVLEARGSVPQIRGAVLLVGVGFEIGTVGGGAAEAKTLIACREALASGRRSQVEIDLAGHPEETRDGVCGGRMRIAVNPLSLDDRKVLHDVADRLAAGEDVHCRIPGPDDDDDDDASGFGIENSANVEQSIRFIGRDVMIVVGAGHCGIALARLGRFTGRRVILVDDRLAEPDFAAAIATGLIGTDIEMQTSLVTAMGLVPPRITPMLALVTRNFQRDVASLQVMREHHGITIGMMGSRRRIATVVDALGSEGWDATELARIKAPIGLDIGAVSPEEIAVSIMAEMIASR